jgi:hypothetical protein
MTMTFRTLNLRSTHPHGIIFATDDSSGYGIVKCWPAASGFTTPISCRLSKGEKGELGLTI